MYCNDICIVTAELYEHDSTEWRLFIYSSKISLKVVLWNNGNIFPSAPLIRATTMKET